MPFFIEAELQAKRLTGHDHFWKVIRELGARGRTFTVADIVAQTSANEQSVSDYVRRLTRARPPIAGVAGKRDVRNRRWAAGVVTQAVTYRLLQSPGETPSLRRDGTEGIYGRKRQHMWNILRGPQARRGIEPLMLKTLASTEQLPISLLTAREYLQKLDAAGYMATEYSPTPNSSRGSKTYRLRPSMNTGPMAPKLLNGTIIYDPNRKSLIGPLAAEESP